jgi:hypothetical protein
VSKFKLAAILLATAATVAACGGGSSSSSASGSSSTAPQTSSAASAPSSAPAGSASTKAASGGTSNASFCGIAKAEQSQEASEAKALTSDSPQQLEQYEEKALGELSKYASSAPASIRADVQVVVTAVETLFKQLKAVNNDYTKLSPTTLSGLNTPALTKASQAIGVYFATKCGITIPTPGS